MEWWRALVAVRVWARISALGPAHATAWPPSKSLMFDEQNGTLLASWGGRTVERSPVKVGGQLEITCYATHLPPIPPPYPVPITKNTAKVILTKSSVHTHFFLRKVR